MKMEPLPIDIARELGPLLVLEGRTKETPLEEEAKAFATLAPYRDGWVYAGSFSGDSPWERHPQGDEFVHVLSGSATLILLAGDGERRLELKAGTVFVVPRGAWHRFHAPEVVTVMTITPEPTVHSTADDPR